MANEHTHQGPPKPNFPRPKGTQQQTPPVALPAPRRQSATLRSFLQLFRREVEPMANEHTHQGPPNPNLPRPRVQDTQPQAPVPPAAPRK